MIRTKWAVMGVLAMALALGGALLAWGSFGDKAQKSDGRAPAAAQARAGLPVETAPARMVRNSRDIRAIGSLQSDESVKIAAEVPGRIAEILFKEGQPVQQDAPLVKLDDALAQAELADAQARQNLAQSNLDRANQLARTGSGTERARDEAVAASAQGRAAVELSQARLDKHTIRAPFPGIAGLRSVSVGAFVSAGTELVSLEKIDSLKVDFAVPEIFLTDVQVGQKVDVTVDALADRTFPGTIYAIDPAVDVNGRSLRIRSRLPNPEGVLRPGLFARILIKGGEEQVVTVPESAIMPRAGESFVFRVENGKAVETKVELGPRKAGEVEIRKGLAADAVVVTAGQQRLRNGSAVEVITASGAVNG